MTLIHCVMLLTMINAWRKLMTLGIDVYAAVRINFIITIRYYPEETY
jgi:hypothetical protein